MYGTVITTACHLGVSPTPDNYITPSYKGLPKKGIALQLVTDILKMRQSFIFRGDVYKKHPLATCAKVIEFTFREWLGNLTSNQDCLGILVENQAFLTNVLGDPSCTVVQQLSLDYNVIEVLLSLLMYYLPYYAIFDDVVCCKKQMMYCLYQV